MGRIIYYKNRQTGSGMKTHTYGGRRHTYQSGGFLGSVLSSIGLGIPSMERPKNVNVKKMVKNVL